MIVEEIFHSSPSDTSVLHSNSRVAFGRRFWFKNLSRFAFYYQRKKEAEKAFDVKRQEKSRTAAAGERIN
jgi:hypothetical protein